MWNSALALSAVAWWSLVLTAMFGGLAVITGLVGGVAATRAADIKSAEDAKKMADAEARAAEANARAEEAKAEAARVNERLHKAQEMRRLTKPQAEALKPLLKSPMFQTEPKSNLRVSTVSDAEAESFALELQKFFVSCEVNIYPTSRGGPNEHFQLAEHATGLALAVNNATPREENQPFVHFQRLAQASGLDVTVELNPDLGDREAVLYVMRKPPA